MLATTKPIYIAPVMNVQMYQHPATIGNINILKSYGYHILPTECGEQACGDIGKGRMLEPIDIFNHISRKPSAFKVMITAGGTQEAIDSVPYLSNHSSGKMGYAIAQSFADIGCEVILISAPTTLEAPCGITVIPVKSALEMHNAVLHNISGVDVFIGAAAVDDYRPRKFIAHKLKKQDNSDELMIHLVKNPDIIAEVAALQDRPMVVGFAAETDNAFEYALDKVKRKNLDLIVINQVDPSSGYPFGEDTNSVAAFNHSGEKVFEFHLSHKCVIARHICSYIAQSLRFND